MGRAKRFYREHELLSLGIVVIVGAAVAYSLWSIVNPHTVAQRTVFIQMLVGMVGGVTLIVGLLLNFRGQNQNQSATSAQLELTRKTQDQNQKNTIEQIKLTRRGQVTERFTKAIEQLGEDEKRDVRLGGIYALKQIVEEQTQIAEQADARARRVEILGILAAYVREHATHEPKRALPRADYDVEAALNVIKDLTESYKPWEDKFWLRLPFADLFGFDVSDIHLENANLVGVHLEETTLQRAYLEEAYLPSAHLENADLSGAHLEWADLQGAHLEGANLSGAKLMGARFGEADLPATNLQGAVLKGRLVDYIDDDVMAYLKATYSDQLGLSQEEVEEELRATSEAKLRSEQIKQAIGNDDTVLPSGVKRPKWWKKAPNLSYPSTEPQAAGDYSIILGESLMSFRLGDGWYANFDYLPYYFSLSRTGVGIAGPQLGFAHVESVFDPEKLERLEPEEYWEAIVRKTPDIAWFRRHSGLEPGDSKTQQDLVGDPPLPGAQLEFTVNPDKTKDILGHRQRCIPLLKTGRSGELAVAEGVKTCVIVLNAEGESLIIQVGGPDADDEYGKFLEHVTEILKSVKWPDPEQRLEEAPEG